MKICAKCKNEKEDEEFSWRRTGVQRQYHCKICQKEFGMKSYSKNRQKRREELRIKNKDIRERNREVVYKYLLTHPCVDCGEPDPIVLEFDHLRDKQIAISSMISGWSLDSILKEIEKCEVCCANCHRRRTARRAENFRFKKNTDVAQMVEHFADTEVAESSSLSVSTINGSEAN